MKTVTKHNFNIDDNPMLNSALDILGILDKNGAEAFIVGGAVRDLVMYKTPKDIDIVTNFTVQEIERIFPEQHDIGKNKQFGISVVKHNGFDFEIATYRTDEYEEKMTQGKGASKVKNASSFKEDVQRRDFNINSMGLDKNLDIVDFNNGLEDIENGVINTVGDPNKRFQEDYLRMLRAVRFAAKLDFEIEEKVKIAIKNNADKIKNVAPERLFKELLQMASQNGNKFSKAIMLMDELNLLQYILPEISEMKKFEHHKTSHPEGGVFEHTIEALKVNMTDNSLLNLSILFHDVGKIKTFSISENGRIQYLQHEKESVSLIEDICKRLKIDNARKEALQFAALNHMKFHKLTEMSQHTILNLMQSEHWNLLVETSKADVKSRGEFFKAEEWTETVNLIERIKAKFEEQKSLAEIKKVVNGNWVMEIKNISKPCKEVGDAIKKTVEWIVNENIDLNNKEIIKEFIAKISNSP